MDMEIRKQKKMEGKLGWDYVTVRVPCDVWERMKARKDRNGESLKHMIKAGMTRYLDGE